MDTTLKGTKRRRTPTTATSDNPLAPPLETPPKRPRMIGSSARADMFRVYQPWVVATYGDAAKTKTVSLSKHARIVRTLRGEEPATVENSKFRFWVRAKGFRLGPPPGHVAPPQPDPGTVALDNNNYPSEVPPADPALYVPYASLKVGTITTHKKLTFLGDFNDSFFLYNNKECPEGGGECPPP